MNTRNRARKGGVSRARKLSAESRRHIAKVAARARWSKDPRKILADKAILAGFCRKHGISSLLLFGSALTKRFNKKSDVDLLYVLRDGNMSYDGYCRAIDEMEEILGRKVDFVNKAVIESCNNPYKRQAILGSSKVIYEEEARQESP